MAAVSFPYGGSLMDAVNALLGSIDFPSSVFWKSALLLAAGTLLLGAVAKFLFGRQSILKQSVSSAIGILFVYAATIVFFSLGDAFRSFVAPLPMVHLSGTKMNLFSFSGADYTIICTQVLSMIILAFLANLVDAVLPKGERILSWLFFRCLSVVLAIAGNLVIHWLFTSYLPEGLVTYAPTILLALLIILLLVGALKLLVGILIATVNPLIAAFYTFFFSTVVGKALTKAILTAGILCLIILGLEHIGCSSISIASEALIAYIPMGILLLIVWYIVGIVL